MAKNKKSVPDAKSIFRIGGYSIGIGEAWIASAVIGAVCICLAVCAAGGTGIGIKLMAEHRTLQGLLYLGTGLVCLGLTPPCVMGEIKFISVAVKVTKMLAEKIRINAKGEEK